MRITEIESVIKSVEFNGENFINLLELYQYEFCCTEEIGFDDYILKLTGKEKIEDISEEIICCRRKCFSTCDEPDKLIEFLKFLLENKNLKEEIERTFGDYAVENLYLAVY